MPLIYVLNGPNLNRLGQRQPEIYGRATLADIESRCTVLAGELGVEVRFHQSHSEAEIIGWIHQACGDADAIVINAAAFTHTSVAILDALKMFHGPVIEVHLSQIHKREIFRHVSYVSRRADGVIVGLGTDGYDFALRHAAGLISAGYQD